MNKYEEHQRREYLLSLIPRPQDLEVPDEVKRERYDKWIEWVLIDIARQIEKSVEQLHGGEKLIYAFPSLRDMGDGYRMWQKHWQHVVELLSVFYHVEQADMMHISSNVPGLAISLKKAID